MLPDLGAAGYTTKLGGLLKDYAAGKPEALDDIVRHAQDRLRRFASKMLSTSAVKREWHDTDDLLQGALIRLARALRDCKPTAPKHFAKLAMIQLVREIRDLGKSLRRQKRDVRKVTCLDNHGGDGGTSPRAVDPADPATNPEDLLDWTEFHNAIERLPEEQRDIMHQVFYNGQTHEQAAAILGISSKTVQRTFRKAEEALAASLKSYPGTEA